MSYLVSHFPLVLELFGQHLRMTLQALFLALAVALPLGILLARVRWLRPPVFGLFGLIYTIPSLALLVVLVPFFGLGLFPAVIALVAYTQFVLTRSWVLGLTSIDPSILEAADAMGMNSIQRFFEVEMPLALPHLLSGIRLAAVTIISIGSVAAFVNAGGLGQLLFEGVVTANREKIFAGGLVIALFAVAANSGLRAVEKAVEQRTRGTA